MFLSPPPTLASKNMKKTPTTFYMQNDAHSPHNFNKKINTNENLKYKKSSLKTPKQSLQLIEEMLMNHVVNVNTKS